MSKVAAGMTTKDELKVGRQTLLVVDDEEGPRQSLRMVFRGEYNVAAVESGEKAIGFIRNNPVHAVVLDIRMAGISGIEVLRQIKAISPQTEVIMLTAYETLETARQAIRYGACDYLSKPFDLATIRDAVSRAMRLRTASDNVAATFERFHQLTDELHDANLREEMARTASEIYAGVLHDVNNPLTIISGIVEMLESQIGTSAKIAGPTLDDTRAKIGIIAKQTATCAAIINRYLKLVRNGQVENHHISVNLVLSDLVSLLKSHPAARTSRIIVKPLEDDLLACINCTDLIQVLLNLAINAFQSTSKTQKVEICAERIDGPVGIERFEQSEETLLIHQSSFQNRGPIVAISVIDQGRGIQGNNLRRVIQPYFTTKSSDGGTGLGLSIVSRLIKNSGGMMYLVSKPGVGTRVTIYLPAVAPAGN